MRLIDADELRKQLSTMCPLYATDEYDYCTKDILEKVDDLVQKQPTAYDVDKVVERLEVNSMFAQADNEPFVMLDDAVEIVKSDGIE